MKAISENNDLRLTAMKRFAFTTTCVTAFGHLLFGFEQAYAVPFVGLFFAYATQLILEWASANAKGTIPGYAGGFRNLFHFLLPAHIVGLTCAMFIYPGDRLSPIAFAATLAIASKYLFQVKIGTRYRHFLNPSNLGILATLSLFPAAGIVLPYQFSSQVSNVVDVAFPIVLFAAGFMLNFKLTHRIPLVIGWLGSFAVQAVARYFLVDHSLVSMFAVATGPVAMLFTFFMVTDPMTTPDKPLPQVIYGASVGILYGILVMMHVVYALFAALVIVCCVRGLIHFVNGKSTKSGSEMISGGKKEISFNEPVNTHQLAS